jgi:hypothetical protein
MINTRPIAINPHPSSGMRGLNRKRWLIRNNPGVKDRQPGESKTEKTEFTGAGILRDAENFRQGDRQTIDIMIKP